LCQKLMKASYLKAKAVADKVGEGIVIGADTVTTINGERLGKPRDEKHAYEMHRKLQGQIHIVLTGLTVVNAATGEHLIDHVITKVKTRPYTDEDIRPYLDTGVPLNCAGAYAIQHDEQSFKKFIDNIDGDYFSIVGLPLHRLKEMLEHFGVKTCEPSL
jgi:septum formation protein